MFGLRFGRKGPRLECCACSAHCPTPCRKSEAQSPERPSNRRFLQLAIAILIAPIIALSGGGCAQKQSPHVTMIKPHGHAPGARHDFSRAYANVDLEDDGFEAQQPPLLKRAPETDDPNQPFSPNYGRVAGWDQTSDTYGSYDAADDKTRAVTSIQHSMLR